MVGYRGSFVFQMSELAAMVQAAVHEAEMGKPARCEHRVSNEPAEMGCHTYYTRTSSVTFRLQFSTAQKRRLVLLVMLPIESNDMDRDPITQERVPPPSLGVKVVDYPINRKGGGSAEEMRPYVEYFRSLGWDSSLALEDVAPKTQEQRDQSTGWCSRRCVCAPAPDDKTLCAPMQSAI